MEYWSCLKLQGKLAKLPCAYHSVSHTIYSNANISEEILIFCIKAHIQVLPTKYNLSLWFPSIHSPLCMLHDPPQHLESVAHIMNSCPSLKGLYIARHDRLVDLIAAQIPSLTCGSAPLNSHGSGELVQSAGVWPWMASLQNNGSHICGGSLVAANAVLSAAACFTVPVTNSNWSVVLGRQKQSGTNVFEVTLGVESIKFSNLTGDNVALLILSGPVTPSDYIQPLCQDKGTVNFLSNSDCWLAGWGQGEGGGEFPIQTFPPTPLSFQ
ncbi:Serine protease 41 [Merluccius polli]|uniref:Serine protease 41 n=1 Tax=Merluccius polli TaxID=89951 RepID=A0AA47MQG7_MERPO|nr:Serine protease 41 [Merluccius polli]